MVHTERAIPSGSVDSEGRASLPKCAPVCCRYQIGSLVPCDCSKEEKPTTALVGKPLVDPVPDHLWPRKPLLLGTCGEKVRGGDQHRHLSSEVQHCTVSRCRCERALLRGWTPLNSQPATKTSWQGLPSPVKLLGSNQRRELSGRSQQKACGTGWPGPPAPCAGSAAFRRRALAGGAFRCELGSSRRTPEPSIVKRKDGWDIEAQTGAEKLEVVDMYDIGLEPTGDRANLAGNGVVPLKPCQGPGREIVRDAPDPWTIREDLAMATAGISRGCDHTCFVPPGTHCLDELAAVLLCSRGFPRRVAM
jgi:hypothetical protein